VKIVARHPEMVHSRYVVWLALLGCTAASTVTVTPIEKVITLIDDMKKKVEAEGRTEAKAYGDFACFCKKTTGIKSASIIKENDNIDAQSADIADKTQSKEEDTTELGQRKNDQVKFSKQVQESSANWAKALSQYQVEEADYNKAISSLRKAIKAMKASKPSAASFLSVRTDLSETLALAEALNLATAPKRKAISSLLQGKVGVDPKDPEYDYHSNDIIELLESLHKEFTGEKKELDSEHNKAKKAHEALQASLKKKMSANQDAMDALVKSIAKLSKEIAKHREDLDNSEETLKDDRSYLEDLTKRCEARANDFDQRSAMRNDEVTALSTALKVLKDEVQPADKVNVRALFLQRVRKQASEPKVAPSTARSLSFLQLHGAVSQQDRANRALAMLSTEGARLNSLVLTALAAQSAADPFRKVKGLIQKLIERLLAESEAEATKKGFCDTELGKARKDRDFRFEEANDLSADLAALEAKRDALTEEIKLLTRQLKQEKEALEETTKERKEEKAANAETLKTSQEGHEAVSEALLVLRSFYKQAAKASLLQASPVDEDTAGAGFSGSYQGQQSGSKSVLALLETIQSDFDRTIRATEAAEEAAHRDFVDFTQASKMSIASKTTKKELDQQDLKTTKTSIETKTAGLVTAMDLLDSALKELEELKPTCIDTGMSYSERVKKREQEMVALKKALCILDGENVEKECQ